MAYVPSDPDHPPAEPEATASDVGEAHADRGSPTAETHPVPPRTKAGSAWVGLAVVTFFLVVLVVFIAQNTDSVSVRFLGWQGHTPLSVALLIAAIVAALLVLAVGTARIAQLRKTARREARRATRQR